MAPPRQPAVADAARVLPRPGAGHAHVLGVTAARRGGRRRPALPHQHLRAARDHHAGRDRQLRQHGEGGEAGQVAAAEVGQGDAEGTQGHGRDGGGGDGGGAASGSVVPDHRGLREAGGGADPAAVVLSLHREVGGRAR